MKEIKFRGKEIGGQWVYGDLLRENDNRFGGQFFKIFVDTNDVEDEGELIRVDGSSIGQFYMNLQTYNNEIQSFDAYEGDIIEVGRYTPTEYYIVVIEDIRKTPDNLFGSNVVSRKLLGNIHENPELLKS